MTADALDLALEGAHFGCGDGAVFDRDGGFGSDFEGAFAARDEAALVDSEEPVFDRDGDVFVDLGEDGSEADGDDED